MFSTSAVVPFTEAEVEVEGVGEVSESPLVMTGVALAAIVLAGRFISCGVPHQRSLGRKFFSSSAMARLIWRYFENQTEGI